jgi:putative ABC transport system permease protein
MGKLLQDVRYGTRMLLKSPGFTVVAIAVLALGIGATSAIFSVFYGVMIKPLPYPTADRLVFFSEYSQQVPNMSVSYPNFADWRAQNTTMEVMAAFRSASYTLTGAGEPERLAARQVSHDFFPALGVQLAAGRNFLADEDKPGAERTGVNSPGLWQRRFGGDASVIGRQLVMNDESYQVVGILPQGFEWQAPVDVWVPIGLRADAMNQRGNHPGIYVIGLLKPGVSVEAARADMDAVVGRLRQQYPQEMGNNSFTIQTLHRRTTDSLRLGLRLVMVAVIAVLLIVCVNVANLLLARSAARSKEMAIRAAMGAGRGRIIRQLLTESTMLALAGGALGLLLAMWGLDALLATLPDGIPQLLLTNIRLDWFVVLAMLAVSVVTGLLFGLAPAVQISKTDLNESLKEGGRSGSGGTHHYVRNTLVVAEVAVSILLLVCAGLLVKSFLKLKDSDIGFNPENVLTASVSLPERRYAENPKIENFYRSLLQRVQSRAGVESAGLTVGLPMNGGIESSITVEGREVHDLNETVVAVNLAVSPEYLRTMQIPLVAGRHFTEQDREGAPYVAIVDEMLAEKFFPGESAIGKRLHYGPAIAQAPWMEIVGVVKHVKHYGPNETARVEMYRPYMQMPFGPLPPGQTGPPPTLPRGMTIAVRTAGDPEAITPALRQAVLEQDRDLPIAFVRTMDAIVAQQIGPQKFATWLLGVFAAVALLLAALGIYGVISYSVTQRTHEIGVRMALGADRGDVLKMIVGQGMRLTLVGVALGLGGAFLLMRYGVSSLLYGVTASDPLTYGGVACLLAGVALVSCLLPARRATKVDPMVALRYE